MTASVRHETLRARFTVVLSVASAIASFGLAACAETDVPQAPAITAPNATPLTRLPAGYAIDRTEVTRGQYEAWLATHPVPSGRAVACAAKEDFAPDVRCLATFDRFLCQGDGCGDHPQVCVDWCDAHAYCEAAGKRLCGRLGGGSAGLAKAGAAGDGEWENACSAGGTTRFAVGNDLTPGACNTQSANRNTTAGVGEMAACRSSVAAYSELLDLSGNAWEWENACSSDDASAFCQVRGGSFNSEEALDTCAAPHTYKRDFTSYYVGFRCCAD